MMKRIICHIFICILSLVSASAFGRCGERINLTESFVPPETMKLAGFPEKLRLERKHLKCADLNEQNLSHMLFLHADLEAVQLIKSKLIESQLINATLRRSYLNMADLSGANLTNADLSEADLRGANFDNANLSGANLEGAEISDTTSFKNANLTNCNLKNMRFQLGREPWNFTVLDPTIFNALFPKEEKCSLTREAGRKANECLRNLAGQGSPKGSIRKNFDRSETHSAGEVQTKEKKGSPRSLQQLFRSSSTPNMNPAKSKDKRSS